MPNICKRCGVEEEHGILCDKGAVCTVCFQWYHLGCMAEERRSRSVPIVCDACVAAPGGSGRESLFGPRVNSTAIEEDSEDPRDVELKELRELVKTLMANQQQVRPESHTTRTCASAIATSVTNVAPSYTLPVVTSTEVTNTSRVSNVARINIMSGANRAYATEHNNNNGMSNISCSTASSFGLPAYQRFLHSTDHQGLASAPSGASAGNHGIAENANNQPNVSHSQLSGLGQDVNNSSLSISMNRSLWLSRLPLEVLRRAAPPAPLTKDQIVRRKTMNTVLPEFDGNPLMWLHFICSYLGTCGQICGFTVGEDLGRIRAALRGVAYTTVQDLLYHDENLDSVLGMLQLSFGETSMILAAMSAKVDALPPLAADLKNIALFAGRVDQLRNVNNMMDGRPPQLEIVQKIERKLPLVHAEKWLLYKAQAVYGMNTSLFQVSMGPMIDGTLDQMADFLLMLYRTMASLGLHKPQVRDSDEGPGSGPRSKPPSSKKVVLAVHEVSTNHPDESTCTPTLQANERSPVARESSSRKSAWWQRMKEKRMDVLPDDLAPAPEQCPFKCGNAEHNWGICPEFKRMSVEAKWNWTKKQRRCFLCFGSHQQSNCKTEAVCNVNNCGKRHHPLLHPVGVEVYEVMVCCRATNRSTLFRCVPVLVSHNGVERKVLLLMDSGSSVTLISTSLADELGLAGPEDHMSLSWADGEVQLAVPTQCVQFEVKNITTGQRYEISGKTHNQMKLPTNRVDMDLLEREGLSHLPILCHEEELPLILLGQDNTIKMRTISSVVGASERVVASETPLGYTVEGERVVSDETVLFVGSQSDTRMERKLTEFIEGEQFGLQPDQCVVAESDENRRARRMMEESTKQRADGRYEVGLLWKSDDIQLPNNRDQAVDRCRSFMKKLDRNPLLRDKVMEVMASHVKNGYARRVASAVSVPGRVWYLPVFNVHNPAKPDKVRLVYDAAAVYKNVSLNSVLLTGPDLTVSLIHVLLRFRSYPVAISGDLQDMYHRVYVREQDRSVQRFVWPEGESMVDYEMCVLTFGATCSPTLAQYAKNVNALQYEGRHPTAVNAIICDHYIDDWLGGANSVPELTTLAKSVINIHGSGGFKMHKFQSNSVDVLRALGVKSTDGEKQLSTSAILGMTWNTEQDTLALRFRAEKFKKGLIDGTVSPTKREMLSVVMSIYDPLGLASFLTIEAKIVLREAWRENAGWDDKLDGAIQRRWADWTSHLSTLQDIVVPRWHNTTTASVDLHVFVDASETAIAAVVYVVQQQDEQVIRSIVLSKCLVAPIKTKSIPRLELDAAVLGVRVVKILLAANPWSVSRIVYWTDAKDVLWWLKSSTRRYTPYVANRVAAILEESVVDQWRWTPTQLNPADWGTKWDAKRSGQQLWWHGPDFLGEEEALWPEFNTDPQQLLEIRPLLLIQNDDKAVNPENQLLPDVRRFSKWLVYKNACAIVLKFVKIVQKKTFPGELHEHDLLSAEVAIFRNIQVGILKIKKFAPFIATLAPFFDQHGVLRMRGRAARSPNIPVEARFPIIVPDNHPAIVLLISYYHHRNGHQNTTTVLNELRQKVIMPRMKAAVKRVIGFCRTCAVTRAKPIVPQMSALPLSRMAVYMASFSFIGIDYWGPQNVVIGRRHEKRWGVLITCLTTRAVYLELAYSLSTTSCIAALDSLVARRGMPLEIHSDNATCFVGAAKEFVGPFGQKPLWRFLPPRCPSMGGAWERLVGVVKRSLEGMVIPRTPTEERLRHALVKAERIVNSRPLFDIPVDPEEEECLTPNHFLLGSSSGVKPRMELVDFDPNAAVKQWDELVDAFWTRFIKEYLPTISARSVHTDKTRNLEVGDLVFVCDDDYRLGWQRAEVKRTVPDKESGQVRQVVVQTADGKEMRRATSKLAVILRHKEDV